MGQVLGVNTRRRKMKTVLQFCHHCMEGKQMALRKETLEKYVSLASDILKEVARGKRKDRFITYEELMHEMGGPGRGYIAEVLDEVSCIEHANGRPLITALVIHKGIDSRPGYGFWYIRVLPDSIKNASDYDKISFWQQECERIWRYWGK